MIIREALTQGSIRLKAAGIESSSLDASLLLANVLNISRTALAAKGTEPLSEKSFAIFNNLVRRRLSGECIAYIIGKKEFFSLEFMVNQNVLVPRPDTEILVEMALKILEKNYAGKFAANTESASASQSAPVSQPAFVSQPAPFLKPSRVLDLCTGCGAVAISIKHEMPSIEVFAADISKEALTIAKINAKHILHEGSHINFIHGNLFRALPKFRPPFSLIVSNPPYIPSGEIRTLPAEVQNEPRLALDGGKSGLNIIKQIIKKAPSFLERGGALLLEADPHQMNDIAVLLDKRGFRKMEVYLDLSGYERVIGGIFDKKK